MKHHDPGRPVGKCKGCCLNGRTRCLGGLLPRERWDHGRCTHYNDTALLERVLSGSAPTGAKLARLRRKAHARIADTEPHHNGVLDPGKMAGRRARV